MTAASEQELWPISSPQGRWKGFGPYYAMFPVSFAYEYIQRYSIPGDTILDPFCGRGTSNYVANLLGRHSVGCDVNPVAWIYSKVKTDPARRVQDVLARVDQIWESRVASDFIPENDFQELAWSRPVLAFLNSARRELNWRKSKIDWTTAGIIMVYLHGKLGGALSNQMRQSKSMAPDYAVRWWRQRQMHPPEINPVEFLKKRIVWRYQKGITKTEVSSRIMLGGAQKELKNLSGIKSSLLITSPPYLGITNYEYDNWIRLWLLGGNPLPGGSAEHRYANKEKYELMLQGVFAESRRHLRGDASLVIRTDRRPFTLETTAYVLDGLWPHHRIFGRPSVSAKPTQTALFGDKSSKPGEVDLLALPVGKQAPKGFIDLREFSKASDRAA